MSSLLKTRLAESRNNLYAMISVTCLQAKQMKLKTFFSQQLKTKSQNGQFGGEVV